jgi:mRNA deadenylase 3'-5' endonuclease subunit Ccr4
MSFTIVSWNVLATGYIRPSYYPRTPEALLEDAARLPRVVERVVALDADFVCLQEVEAPLFAQLEARLDAAGYDGRYARKSGRRPDGCAIFARRGAGTIEAWRRIAFEDGAPPSGHIALLVRIALGKRRLGLAATHLKWSPRGTPPGDQVAVRQAREIVAAIGEAEWRSDGWILCGDLNAEAGDAPLAALYEAGFADAYAGLDGAFTCNANGVARRIDFLLHTEALGATPMPVRTIDGTTPLPDPDEPSDHLPIGAEVAWRT